MAREGGRPIVRSRDEGECGTKETLQATDVQEALRATATSNFAVRLYHSYMDVQ